MSAPTHNPSRMLAERVHELAGDFAEVGQESYYRFPLPEGTEARMWRTLPGELTSAPETMFEPVTLRVVGPDGTADWTAEFSEPDEALDWIESKRGESPDNENAEPSKAEEAREHARQLLELAASIYGREDESTARDIVADLCHLWAEQGQDPAREVQTALMHYRAEAMQ